jgi:hypothetical protein
VTTTTPLTVPSVPRLIFWSVTPAAVAVGGSMLLGFSHYSFAQKLLVCGMEVLFALVIVSLAAPHRYLGASRLLAACAAALYVLWFLDGVVGGARDVEVIAAVTERGLTDAVLGLLLFALPCAVFAVRGSLFPRRIENEGSQAMGAD